MKKNLLCLLFPFFLAAPVTAFPEDPIPNASLRVTVQQKDGGIIADGFHVLELRCFNGYCSLSTVSLNQCVDTGSGKMAFYPGVQYSATWMGNLKVRNDRKGLVVQETGSDAFGDYVNNLRFDYETIGEGDSKIASRLVGFSGGYVKNSALLKKVITTEYVPLSRADQIKRLDCDVLLPGVDKK
jgi:hypothetical protein